MTSVPPPLGDPAAAYVSPAPFEAQPYSAAGASYIAAPPVRSSRLGRIALIVAIVVFVLSITISVIVGVGAIPFTEHSGRSFSFNLSANSTNRTEAALAVLGLLQVAFGTGLGLWALVQGIVAIATRRGRAFGVAALVIAVLAPVLSVVAELATVAIASSH
jgi:hypothetical protein